MRAASALHAITLAYVLTLLSLLLPTSIGISSAKAGFRRRLADVYDKKRSGVPTRPVYKYPYNSRIDAHFLDMSSFYESSRNLEEGPLISCVPYSKATSARLVLTELYKGVHAIFQDHKLDRVCYMMTHPKVDVRGDEEENKSNIRGYKGAVTSSLLKHKLKDMADHIDVLNEFTAWHYMHPVVKIHPSVINHLLRQRRNSMMCQRCIV